LTDHSTGLKSPDILFHSHRLTNFLRYLVYNLRETAGKYFKVHRAYRWHEGCDSMRLLNTVDA